MCFIYRKNILLMLSQNTCSFLILSLSLENFSYKMGQCHVRCLDNRPLQFYDFYILFFSPFPSICDGAKVSQCFPFFLFLFFNSPGQEVSSTSNQVSRKQKARQKKNTNFYYVCLINAKIQMIYSRVASVFLYL